MGWVEEEGGELGEEGRRIYLLPSDLLENCEVKSERKESVGMNEARE